MKPTLYILISAIFVLSMHSCEKEGHQSTPNVLLIITDDQGFGDMGYYGNHHIKTPVMDSLAEKSLRLTNFYVSPVCAPTRASLMTGRYSLRTGVHDTYNGGAIMATEEVTMAELFKTAGYRTGLFGKWHLGDNYPSRPMDQGFDESVMHLSGGMGQVGDFTTWFEGDSAYFNPVLWHNGQKKSYSGYCSDIFTREAIDFMIKESPEPFFCYLSFNAPHTPLQVPQKYLDMYEDIDPESGFEDKQGRFPSMNNRDKEAARRVYAMVTNIDDNMRRLFNQLKERSLLENTLVIFMTDNGPQQRRYIAGMRGRKGSVYEGGVRVPCFWSWPARFEEAGDINETTAHIDVLPTLADMCNIPIPPGVELDGKSLLSLMEDEQNALPDRALFLYWTRRYPEKYNNIGWRRGDFKLVGHTDYDAPLSSFELYDISEDPFELNNLVEGKRDRAGIYKKELDSMYHALVNSPNLKDPPRAVIGHQRENPVVLNRNDAAGERGIWAHEEVYGYWNVRILEGNYTVRFKFIQPVKGDGKMVMETGTTIHVKEHSQDSTDMIVWENVSLSDGECRLIPHYDVGRRRIFPFWVEFEKITD